MYFDILGISEKQILYTDNREKENIEYDVNYLKFLTYSNRMKTDISTNSNWMMIKTPCDP